jgi:hypothetical protein
MNTIRARFLVGFWKKVEIVSGPKSEAKSSNVQPQAPATFAIGETREQEETESWHEWPGRLAVSADEGQLRHVCRSAWSIPSDQSI